MLKNTEKQLKALGFNVEDFIPIVIQFGTFNKRKSIDGKIVFESYNFRFVIQSNYKRKNKTWLLTAFDIPKKLSNKTLGTIKTVHADGFTLGTLLQKTNVSIVKLQKKTTPPTLSGVMSVPQAINSKFELIGLDGNYLKLIGEACRPTSIFIYGGGGSGKSTFTVLFSNYLAQKNNKVLYVACKQYGTPVFSKMLTRLKIIDTPNFAFTIMLL